jgi:hypothetical protein
MLDFFCRFQKRVGALSPLQKTKLIIPIQTLHTFPVAVESGCPISTSFLNMFLHIVIEVKYS